MTPDPKTAITIMGSRHWPDKERSVPTMCFFIQINKKSKSQIIVETFNAKALLYLNKGKNKLTA